MKDETKNVGKKVGAGALAVMTALMSGVAIHENGQADSVQKDLETLGALKNQVDQQNLNLQEQLNEIKSDIENGELVKKEEIDLSSDNQAAIEEALKAQAEASEDLVFDEESGKLVVSPKVVEEQEEMEEQLNGFEIDDLSLGESINDVDFKIDNHDLDKLFEGDVSFDGKDFKVKESIDLTSDMKIAISGSSDFSKSFGAIPHLAAMGKKAVERNLKFMGDSPNFSKVSRDNPLEVRFLNKDMKITKFEEHGGKWILEFMKGERLALSGLEPVEVEGKGVALISCSNDAIIVSVDGESEIVDEGESKEINGLSVHLDSVFNRENMEDSMAVVVIGSESFESVGDEDEFEEDEAWEWSLSEDKIAVVHNEILNEEDEAYKPGEVLEVPGDVSISFELVEEDMEGVSFSLDQEELNSESDQPVVVISTESKDGLLAVLAEDDELHLDEAFFNGSAILVENDENEMEEVVSLKLSESGLLFNLTSGCDLQLDDVCIGANLTSLEDQKFSFLGVPGLDLSDRDEDTLTQRGIVISGVDDIEDIDEVELSVPEEQVEAIVRVA